MTEDSAIPRKRPPKWVPVALTSLGQAVADPPAGSPDPPAPDPMIGRVFGGKFRIVDRLGQGGMAVVYLAEEIGRLKREVAIKVLAPESALSPAISQRFFKEAQAIAAIQHPNVVKLIDIDKTDTGQIYMVMERLVGKTMHQLLREMAQRGEAFSWEQLAPLMLQICSALNAAHKQKIVHRDMKPSNCFFCEVDEGEWHVKLLDFGVAKIQPEETVSADSIDTPLTQKGMFVGTHHYAAPEVIRRIQDQDIDGRADIFALGVMMYQCLTGTLPFQHIANDVLSVLYHTVHEQPQSPRERAPERMIAPDVDALVMKAMAIDRAERFSSVSALNAAIRATLRPGMLPPGSSGSGMEVTPPSSSPPAAITPDAAAPQPPPRLDVAPSSSPPAGMASMVVEPSPPPDLGSAAPPARTAPPAGALPSPVRPLEESATPPPREGGVSPASSESPTLVHNTQIHRIAMLMLIAMLLGLVLLIALILMEAFSGGRARAETAPSDSLIPSVSRLEPKPSRTVNRESLESPKKEPKPPVEPPSPPAKLREQADPAIPAPSPLEPESTPPPPVPEKAEDDGPRRAAIIARLDQLAQAPSAVRCLPLNLGFADGVFDKLPLRVTVNAKGQASAKVSARKVEPRLAASAEPCLLKLIEATVFEKGSGSLTVQHTLQFD